MPNPVAEGASSDLPDEIYVERDAETNEKRWFSCKGMGEKYVHARLLDNWKFVAKHGLAKVTPEHTWAQWLAEITRERDQARTEVDRLEKLVYVPGLWRCPKCEFQLLQANLNAHDGSVTARDQPGDKCPNCDGPLWRVTERDAGNKLIDDSERVAKQRVEIEREACARIADQTPDSRGAAKHIADEIRARANEE